MKFVKRLRAKISDVFNSDNTLCDPSLDTLNKILISSRIVSGGINELVSGLRDKKRLRFTKFLIVVYAILSTRSALYFVGRAVKSATLLAVIGDYFAALNINGDIVMFWLGLYSFLLIIWSTVAYRAEAHHYFDIVTDFRKTADGTKTLIAKHLSSSNFRKFKVRSKLTALFITNFRYSIYALGYSLHMYGVYFTYCTYQDVMYSVYTAFWCAICCVWLYYALYLFAFMQAILYLASVHLKMRYKQVNEVVSWCLNNQMAQRQQLMQVLRNTLEEHNEISNLVSKYDRVAKWILFGLNDVCSLIVAVALMASIFGHFPNVLYKFIFIGCSLNTIVVIVFFAGVAGGVHKQVRHLNTIHHLTTNYATTGSEKLRCIECNSSEIWRWP